MDGNFTLKLNHMLKKSIISATMICVVLFALASSGGGKKRSAIPNPSFIPLRSSGTFTLKSRSEYSGSQMFMRVNPSNLYKSVTTYQKGNTIYVLPSQYRLGSPSKLSF